MKMAYRAYHPTDKPIPLVDWEAVLQFVGSDYASMAKIASVATAVADELGVHVQMKETTPLAAALILERLASVMRFCVDAKPQDMASIPPRQAVLMILDNLSTMPALTSDEMKAQNFLYLQGMTELVYSDEKALFYRLFADQAILRIVDPWLGSTPYVVGRLAEFNQWLSMKAPSHGEVMAAMGNLRDKITSDFDAILAGRSLYRYEHYRNMPYPFKSGADGSTTNEALTTVEPTITDDGSSSVESSTSTDALWISSCAILAKRLLPGKTVDRFVEISRSVNQLTGQMAQSASFPESVGVSYTFVNWDAILQYVGSDETLLLKIMMVVAELEVGLQEHVSEAKRSPMPALMVMARLTLLMASCVKMEESGRRRGDPSLRPFVDPLLNSIETIVRIPSKHLQRNDGVYVDIMDRIVGSNGKAYFYLLFQDIAFLSVLDTNAISAPLVDARLAELREWLPAVDSDDSVYWAITALSNKVREDVDAILKEVHVDRQVHYQDMTEPFVKILNVVEQ